jgi:hypothetical protein
MFSKSKVVSDRPSGYAQTNSIKKRWTSNNNNNINLCLEPCIRY